MGIDWRDGLPYKRALYEAYPFCLVENKFGVLTRISGLFSGRGFNIDTLNVAPTQDPTQSRMTIVVKGDDTVLEQVTKQLNKLVDVIKVQDFPEGEYVDRELVLIKVNATTSRAPRSCRFAIFSARRSSTWPTRP